MPLKRPVNRAERNGRSVYKRLLDCIWTSNSILKKATQFAEKFRCQFSIAKPQNVARQSFGSDNFDVRLARRVRQTPTTRNDASDSRLTETLTKQVVAKIVSTTDLVKRVMEVTGLHKTMAPTLCLNDKYSSGSQHNMIYLRAYKCYPIEADMASRLKPYIVENNRRRGKRTKTIDHIKLRVRSS